ncbi:hypothetical protein ACKFKF_26275 [Phormidesmis sp. 146-12]
MRRFSNLNKSIVGFLLPWLLLAPVVAHEIETSSDVAATFHIEPGHNPKAGVPSKAWFALTRRGGQMIPLSQCNCQLAVYPIPHQKGKTPPLLKPALTSLNVERYKGIPSAAIVFPRAGRYELELTGKPKLGANFQPFSLSYTVTVSR